MPQHRIQRGFIKAPIIVDPSTDYRIEHPRQIFQSQIRLQMHPPASNALPHGLGGFVAHTWSEIYEKLTIPVF
jgi:hypothetical protein